MFKIYPISDFFGKVVPNVGVAHYGFAARLVVFFNGNFLSDVFFGNAEFFFNAKFYGKSVRVPTCFPKDLFSVLSLETAKNILNCSRHHVVNSGHSVSRRWTFIKNKFGFSFSVFYRFFKGFVIVPECGNFFSNAYQI